MPEGKVVGEFILPRNSKDPIRAIYTPEVQKVAEAIGTVELERASHVEPTRELTHAAASWLELHNPEAFDWSLAIPLLPTNKWWADMLPVNGPVLGPFDDRDTALKTESAWLREHNIPVCHKCRGETDEPAVPVSSPSGGKVAVQSPPAPRPPVAVEQVQTLLERVDNPTNL